MFGLEEIPYPAAVRQAETLRFKKGNTASPKSISVTSVCPDEDIAGMDISGTAAAPIQFRIGCGDPDA